MGFFSKITDTLFGDSGEGAAKSQEKTNQANIARIEQAVARARGDIIPLFESGQQSRQLGSQAALDVLSGLIPSQLGVFQQGNVGAQEALSSGLSGFRRDILGLPPQAAPAARRLSVNTGFIPSDSGVIGAIANPVASVDAAQSGQLTLNPDDLKLNLQRLSDIVAQNQAQPFDGGTNAFGSRGFGRRGKMRLKR